MPSSLTHEKRARLYLEAAQKAAYTNLPAEHREAYEAQMDAHERAYPGVHEHALAGHDQDFDKPLQPGTRAHQRHMLDEEGLQHGDVLRIRQELRSPGKGAPQSRSKGRRALREGTRKGSRRSSPRTLLGTGAGAISGAAAGGGGQSTFMYALGLMLGLSLIYLLVAGKGTQAITGVVGVITGGVRAFVAPVDPIAHFEQAVGASPIAASTSSSSEAGASPAAKASGFLAGAASGGFAPGAAPGGGFLARGEELKEYARRDAGRDIRVAPGAPLVAPGAGTVVNVLSDPTGFGPDYPVVAFTSGPYKGKEVYLGHTDSALKKGASFRANQLLARTSRTGHNAPPGWAEIGFASGGIPGHVGQPVPF